MTISLCDMMCPVDGAQVAEKAVQSRQNRRSEFQPILPSTSGRSAPETQTVLRSTAFPANPEARAKGKLATGERIRRHGFLPVWRAIRAKCLDCAGADGANWVRDCTVTECSLWPYRMGRRPKEDDLLVAEIDSLGKVTGHHAYGAPPA